MDTQRSRPRRPGFVLRGRPGTSPVRPGPDPGLALRGRKVWPWASCSGCGASEEQTPSSQCGLRAPGAGTARGRHRPSLSPRSLVPGAEQPGQQGSRPQPLGPHPRHPSPRWASVALSAHVRRPCARMQTGCSAGSSPTCEQDGVRTHRSTLHAPRRPHCTGRSRRPGSPGAGRAPQGGQEGGLGGALRPGRPVG